MNAVMRLTLGSALALGLAGAGLLTAGAARADTDRTDCMGNNCVHVHCYDDTGDCTRTANFDETGAYADGRTAYREDQKAMRYACDEDGANCHWTRSYYFDDDGAPIYDPGAYPQ
ncbi:MAG TPA: hypothetical protein VG843_04435 [Rhizomicrobium sp.]|jgi:hypothetical protein|nr:hypothetical protein [Rhizomicrobium sp.]